MTTEELLAISPDKLATYTDEELYTLIAPLIPPSRLVYAKADELASTANSVLLPNGRRVTATQIQKENEHLLRQLKRMTGAT
jgi:hypothetical protein